MAAKKPTIASLRQRWRDDAGRDVSWLERGIQQQHVHPSDDWLDLRGISLGLPDTPRWLHKASLSKKPLHAIDFSHAMISLAFSGSEVTDCRFDSCFFDTCSTYATAYSDCCFVKARLSSPYLHKTSFTGCDFTDARLVGRGRIVLTYCGAFIRFERCDFSNTTFNNLDMRGIDFVDCVYSGCVFKNCFAFNWRFDGAAPGPDQFIDCEYRGINTGL